MVLALGGIGGYAVGERVHGTTASPQQDSVLGNDWRRQQDGAGTLPFGGGSLPGDGTQPNTDTGTTATASQTTGLVRIVSTLGYQDGEAAGTGMVLTSDGEVVTNHHVVAGATTVKVDRDEHGHDLHREGGRHRHQGRRGRAPARRRQRARRPSPPTATASAWATP